jgi:hypothetical protein
MNLKISRRQNGKSKISLKKKGGISYDEVLQRMQQNSKPSKLSSVFIEYDEMMVFPFLNMANETERHEIKKNNPEQKTKYQEITKKNPEDITDFYAFLYYMKMFIFRIEKHVLKWLGTDLSSIEEEYQNYKRFGISLSRVRETDPNDVYKSFREKYYHYIGEMYRNLQKINYEEIVFPFLTSTDEQRERFRTSNDVQKMFYKFYTKKDPKDIVDYDAFLYYMAEFIFIIEHEYLDDLQIDMKYIEEEYEKYTAYDSNPNREIYLSRVRGSDPNNVYLTFREKYYHHIGEIFWDPNNKSLFSVLNMTSQKKRFQTSNNTYPETTSPFSSLIDSILKSAESQRHDDTSFTEDGQQSQSQTESSSPTESQNGQQSQSQTESSSPTESQHIQSVDKRKNVTIILVHKGKIKEEIEIKIPMETEIEHQINEILLNIQLDLSDTNLKDRFNEIGKLLPTELSQSEKNYIKLYIMKHLQDNSDYSGKILRHLYSRDPSTHYMEVLSIPEKRQDKSDYSIPKKRSLISRLMKKKKITESSNINSQLLSL